MRQRRIYHRAGQVSRLDLGFAAFFLNRTNRSGIIASAGMIGGATQDGHWKIDARYNGPELAERVERIARYRDRIHLFNQDAADFLRHCEALVTRRVLAYLDPPYYVKGQQRLYANYYGSGDHVLIAGQLATLSFPWVVSYDDAPEIRGLYRGRRCLRYHLRYTAAERQHGAEVMFFSDGLVIPSSPAPGALRDPRQAARRRSRSRSR